MRSSDLAASHFVYSDEKKRNKAKKSGKKQIDSLSYWEY